MHFLPRALCVLALLACLGLRPAGAQDTAAALPSLAELEAAGARIGTVRVVTRDIFDLSDPREDKLLFRLANRLHIRTRPEVIERALLFRAGDVLSVRVLEETERILRSNRYLYDVQISATAYHDGLVDIEVATRDTWTLDAGISLGRSGGTNSSGLRLREYNLLGTGITLGLGRSKNVDRTSNEIQLLNDRAFGTWTSIAATHATNSDGRRDELSVVRPFYALDARWAAGASASSDDRLESIYNAGVAVAQYRHRRQRADLFGGWSDGLVDGWVQRYTAGLALDDHRYALDAGVPAPARLPDDLRLAGPYVRYELIEDRYDKELNRNLIGRPEYFALGLNASVQLGLATRALGSSRDAGLYAASVSRGFQPAPQQLLMTAAGVSGRWFDGRAQQLQLSAQLQYYVPQGGRWLFFAGAWADALKNPEVGQSLLLGGDNGLRGYPLRYQGGTRRALFTVEERAYSDLYLWRLFRVGGAAFVDVGRAWGGDNVNAANPGWLANVGMGLRIVSARAAFSNVLHIDFAYPLNTTPDMKKAQILVKTKASF